MTIQEVASKYEEYQVEMRRYFHMHPEVSTQEYNTSKVVKEELDKAGIPWVACGLETGVLATVKGAKPGKTILLRGDMDALSITEETGAPYASQNPGVMHACGHDCHTSMLLTAAKILNDMKDELCGTVKFAFQPAEESALGAPSMIENGAIEGVDGAFGIHVWSGVESGKISCEPGPRMGAANKFAIDIVGKGGHGAEPQFTVDAAVVTSAVVQNLQTIASRNIAPMDPVVVTVGLVEVGSRWNIIAEKGHIEGTTRCFSTEVNDKLPELIEKIAKETAAAFGAEATLTYDKLIIPTVNNADMTAIVNEAAKKVVAEDAPYNLPPTLGGEDFSFFLNLVPGAIAFLGIANEECNSCYPQHNPKYDVDESQLIKGAMLYAQVAMDFNAK